MLKVLQGNEEIIMDFCDTFAIHFNTTYTLWYLLIQCVDTQFLGGNNSVLKLVLHESLQVRRKSH